ncbi:DNA-directed RNA polymerase subunit omega [Radiobacillus kanasensis]|uniref:DNA-directed RNA polymerase subunit omega n=1 Tax=Radiobacillus kanasensis TaxID=2844358 RepID=UPI001E612382|nr:DNA-directed RNA polymerase subunit omega [Radiobacillus kanasensis]UFU00977.1 DNA-directed RNA polymerase subunit omega [Radiobacillus kanasensis]
MMLEPSIDALQEKINSKYTLVTLSARRARQMQETKRVHVENPKSHKYVGIALEEIQADKLYYEAAEE